jgi:hypothetical protein
MVAIRGARRSQEANADHRSVVAATLRFFPILASRSSTAPSRSPLYPEPAGQTLNSHRLPSLGKDAMDPLHAG